MKADQLSKTATFVAIKFYGLTRIKKFRSLFDDSVVHFYDRLVQQLPVPLRYYHYLLKLKWIRKNFIWWEELLLPGDLLHIAARKWYLQKMVDELVEDGYKQIIILGAGFDHLGYYYAKENISCFEFDAPYMTSLKTQFLQEEYPDQKKPELLNFMLPESQLDSLFRNKAEVDPHKKTIIVAEGLFDYLDSSTVESSINQVRRYFSHKPALICTHFALNELPSFHRQVFKSSVQLVGENLQFWATMDSFKQILSRTGYEVSQLHDSHGIKQEINERLDTNLSILKGFYLFMAK